jgi:hypothetical protein
MTIAYLPPALTRLPGPGWPPAVVSCGCLTTIKSRRACRSRRAHAGNQAAFLPRHRRFDLPAGRRCFIRSRRCNEMAPALLASCIESGIRSPGAPNCMTRSDSHKSSCSGTRDSCVSPERRRKATSACTRMLSPGPARPRKPIARSFADTLGGTIQSRHRRRGDENCRFRPQSRCS